MRRWLPTVAFGLLLALVALAVAAALRDGAEPTTAERAWALSAELRCPDCQGLSVADSPTRSAQEIRRQIDALLAGGATDDEVRAHFVARYGEWIRLAPSATALWLIPFGVVGAAALALAAWLVSRGRSRSPAPGSGALTDEERRRLRDEAEALDA
jgi:cytochrome c-type biogenesis protein CcmH